MQEDGVWRTINGRKIFIKNKDVSNYMNKKIRQGKVKIKTNEGLLLFTNVNAVKEKFGYIPEEIEVGPNRIKYKIYQNGNYMEYRTSGTSKDMYGDESISEYFNNWGGMDDEVYVSKKGVK